MERRLIGIATGEIKRLLVGEEEVTSAWSAQAKTTSRRWRQYSFHYPLKDQTQYQTFIWSHGGRPTDFCFFLNAVWAVPQNSHNYLYGSWTRGSPSDPNARKNVGKIPFCKTTDDLGLHWVWRGLGTQCTGLGFGQNSRFCHYTPRLLFWKDNAQWAVEVTHI